MQVDFRAALFYNALIMANIHINRGSTSFGVLPENEVREGLLSGRFLPSDLGWREGMTSWQPLSQFPEFAADISSVPPAPEGTPIPPAAASALAPAAVAGARTGLPWDRRQELGILNAFFETMKMVLLQPAEAFSLMKAEGGLGEPLIYAFIGGGIGFVFYLLFSLLFRSFGMMAGRNPLGQMFGAGIGFIFFLILIPVFLLIIIFVGSAILHLCLMLVGGAKRSFETTARVVCFCLGSTYPLMIVPLCGGVISGVWGIVVECIGLARAHETDTGRAVLAVFLPIIVCCGGGILLSFFFGAMGAIFGNH
jgi:hypothetical protein